MTSPSKLFLAITLPLSGLSLLNQATRTVMAVIGPALALEFSLSASELGLLAACMFASYAAAQLPVGIALDVYGPRRVQALLALLSALGCALFALSAGFTGLVVARVVLGVGVSAALMAILKANTQWFPPNQVANITGISMVVGALGSVLSTAPAQAVLPLIGWRGLFWLLAAAALGCAAWIFLSVRDKPPARPSRGLRAEAGTLAQVLTARQFWTFAPAAAILSTLNFAYLGLWAGPWLRDVAGLDGAVRAQVLLGYTLALMAGGYVTGWAASRAQARGLPGMLVPALCSGGLILAQAGLMMEPAGRATVSALWMMFGFFASGGPAAYVWVNQMFPPELTGRVSTATNTLTLGGAFLLQAAIGALLDLWPRTAAGGWDPRGYTAGMGVSLAACALTLLVAAAGARRRRRP